METEEERWLKYKIQDLEREIEMLKEQINKQADASKTIKELEEKNVTLLTDLSSSSVYQTVRNEDIGKLRALLKGCKLSTFKIYDRLRFSDENEITPADLINAVNEIKPMLRGILNSINAALGENKE